MATQANTSAIALIKKYFPQDQWTNAYNIMMQESGGNPNAVGDTNTPYASYGLFQIRNLPGRGGTNNLTPEQNVAYAANLWKQQGWSPWYNSATKLGLLQGGSGSGSVPSAFSDQLKQALAQLQQQNQQQQQQQAQQNKIQALQSQNTNLPQINSAPQQSQSAPIISPMNTPVNVPVNPSAYLTSLSNLQSTQQQAQQPQQPSTVPLTGATVGGGLIPQGGQTA